MTRFTGRPTGLGTAGAHLYACGPAAAHSPVSDPGVDHSPVSDPGVDHSPVSDPGVDHSPVSDPGVDHSPVSDPGVDHSPACGPTGGHSWDCGAGVDHSPALGMAAVHSPIFAAAAGHPSACGAGAGAPVGVLADLTDAPARPPTLFQPFAHRRHPAAERAADESIAWLRAFDIEWPPGQWAEIESERAGYWWGLFDPGAADYERYRLGVDLITVLFPFDDAYSGKYAQATPAQAVAWAGRWQRLLDDPCFAEPCGHPVNAPMVDVLRRAAAIGTPVQYRRFAEAVKGFISSLGWEFAGQDDAVRADMGEAAACRFYTAGCGGIIGILPITHDLWISDEVACRGVFRAYTEAAVLVLSLYNDLFSYAKEQAEAPHDVNVLAAAVREHDGALDTAFRRVITLHNQAMDRVVCLGSRLRALGSPDLTHYTRAVEEMIAGNLEFGRSAARYRGGEAALPPYTVTRTPPPVPLGPTDIATFAWWWDEHRLTGHRTALPRHTRLRPLTAVAG
ncbi:hypothetical protein [Spongiactinospora sp. 9N601]|uniref:terpene synthase family protein n=1 Tax=Spongiactinospora sp. 9N601 TaxID=3375149 RepID=UPI0037AAC052